MPSGNWRVQIYLGINKEGKKEKKSITAPTRWQAEMLAAKFIQNMQLAKSRFTIAQAVRDYIDSKKNVLSPSTVYGYESILKTRLQSIMDLDINELDSFTFDEGQPISGITLNPGERRTSSMPLRSDSLLQQSTSGSWSPHPH